MRLCEGRCGLGSFVRGQGKSESVGGELRTAAILNGVDERLDDRCVGVSAFLFPCASHQ